MQNELKQISLRWISIFSESESKYVKYNKQSDFLSSQKHENIDRQETSVYLDSPELTVPENTRRFLQTKEDTMFTKS